MSSRRLPSTLGRLARRAGSLIGAAVVAATFLTAPAASAASVVPDARPMATDYYWEWSDGSENTRRTFAQSEYGTRGALPKLVVTAVPARPPHTVYLQYYQDGAWRTEQSRGTDGDGIATLTLNPFCSSGQWCRGTYKYRLTVARKVVRLVITYVRD